MATINNVMYVAFRRGWVDTNLLEKLIALWTGLLSGKDYCHMELVFPDGQSFSADPKDGGRKKWIWYTHPDRWDIFELNIDSWYFGRLFEAAEHLEDKDYDYIGCLTAEGAVLNPSWEDKTKFYCSEICLAVLSVLKYLLIKYKDIHKNPIKAYQLMKRKRLLLKKVRRPFV